MFKGGGGCGRATRQNPVIRTSRGFRVAFWKIRGYTRLILYRPNNASILLYRDFISFIVTITVGFGLAYLWDSYTSAIGTLEGEPVAVFPQEEVVEG